MSGRLRLLGEALITAVIALVLYLCLFADRLVLGSGVLGPILREMAATFRDAGTQWMVFLCATVYFVGFNVLRLRLADRWFWRVNNRDLWLAGALGAGSLAYALNYSAAAASTQALTLLAGATLGQGVAVWSEWRRDDGSRHRFLLVLVALLVVGALWRPDAGRDFAYHGHARWSGPWNSPNIFGLLMGMGVVVAVGQIIQGLRIAEGGSRGRSPSQAGALVAEGGLRGCSPSHVGGLQVVFFLLSAGVLSVGLLHSYSRGAWLATACGLVYLFLEALGFSRGSPVSRVRFWVRRNRLTVYAVLLSVVVLAFWHFHHAEHTVVRRALSAGNVNDFSWRNRVAAWEGALQMMAEQPWFGFGWQQPGRVYENLYLPPKVAEGAAFQLNDHLMLGTSLGLPAFLCFLACVGLSLGRKAEGKRQKAESGGRNPGSTIAEEEGLKISCRAGAIVLFVGFWFDGGLFNMATAAPFWILLELGQAQLQMNKDREGPILTTDEHR